MPIKEFSIDFKSLSDTGSFEGLASTYGNTDLVGDVCMPGCFTRTLADAGKSRPLLWQHRDPVGMVRLTDGPDGLAAKGQLSLGAGIARDAYALMKDGVVRGLSIGYQTVKEQFVGDVRQLLEVKLYEVSLVTFPANELAMIAGVKAAAAEKDVNRIRIALKSFRTDILGALQK